MRLAICSLLLGLCLQASASDCIRDSYGRVVCGKGDCARDQYGTIFCARPGGGAVRDTYGNVTCGVGYCAVDEYGHVLCSRTPAGATAMDVNGKVQCVNGCEDASPRRCEGGK